MLGAAGQAVCGGQGEGLLQGQQDHTLVAGSARVLNLLDSVNGHIYVEFLGQCQCAPSALPADLNPFSRCLRSAPGEPQRRLRVRAGRRCRHVSSLRRGEVHSGLPLGAHCGMCGSINPHL